MGSFHGVSSWSSFAFPLWTFDPRKSTQVLYKETSLPPINPRCAFTYSNLPTLPPTKPPSTLSSTTNPTSSIFQISTNKHPTRPTSSLALDRPYRNTISLALEKKVILYKPGLVWLECIHTWIRMPDKDIYRPSAVALPS